MRKQFLIASIMALGMGIAQAQSGSMPQPMQGGTQSPSRPEAGQTQMGQGAGSTSMNPVGTTGTQAAAPQTFTGCLTRSSNGWSLATDQGKNVNVSGTDNQLSQYSNQEVNIQGVQAEDGSVTVSSVDKVADTCNNNGQAAASTSNGENQPTTTTQSTTQSTTSTQPSTQPPSATDQSSTSAATGESNSVNSSQNANAPASQSVPPATATTEEGQNQTATGTTNPPPGTPAVTSQTPPNNVGSGSTASNAAGSSTSTAAAAASNPDQNAATSSNPPSSAEQTTPSATASNNDQNAGVSQSGAASNQNAGQGTAATSNESSATSSTDQNGVRHISDMPQNGQKAGNLPQTASPLPLLALLGVGSFGAGLLTRRKK